MMKTKIILMVLTMLVSRLNAQNSDHNNSKKTFPFSQVGIKVGYVNSTVYGSQIDIYSSGGYDFTPRNSLSVGIQAKSTLFKWWYMKLELNLLQKGAEIGRSNFIHPPKPYFTYINVPVITGFRLKAIPDLVNIGLEVGLASNIEVSNQENLDQGLFPTIYPSYDKHILEFNYGLDLEFIINKHLSVSTNLRSFKDLDAFFSRIDHYSIYPADDDEIVFRLSEMKHRGWNLTFTLNYTLMK